MEEQAEGDWRGQRLGGMTVAEIDAFLAGPWLARLACLRDDGWPYVVPVWYHWDSEAFWVVARKRSEWAHYIAADPRVSLVVDEPDPPIRKVICEGRAEIAEWGVGPYLDNGKTSIWNRIGEEHTGPRYLGARAAEYRGSVNVEPCTTIRIAPVRLTTWQGFGWHARYRHPELYPENSGDQS
jgi:hypothetical protein